MLYLVSDSYSPNTAPCNRIMAYAKALSELNMKTTMVFFYPDKVFSKFEGSLNNIDFVYYWDNHYLSIPRLKILFIRSYIKQFVKSLQPGDKVFVYGTPDVVVELSRKESIDVFSEITEHPGVSFNNFVNKTTIKDYLEACRRISGVVVISQGLKNFFIENGVSPEKVHVVNMIVDTSRFEKLEKQPSDKYVAYCGTVLNNKDGVDNLIRAFAITASRHSDYKLYIIGNTPSKHQRFGNLALVQSLGIEDSVVFTGTVSRDEIPQLLKNAEILALDRPDNVQAQYGFPTKLGEYLLTGNPVVVTKVGDIPLFLKDGENSLIAAPSDANDFADKLCWAIENPDMAKRIGEKGKKLAELKFNYLLETKKLVSIVFNN